MKLIFILLGLSSCLSALTQNLSSKDRRYLRKEIRVMQQQDQRYRSVLHQFTNQDSIWKLQDQLDSLNKEKLKVLISKYGYPSASRIKGPQYSAIIILHLTLPEHYEELKDLFLAELKSKNMPPVEYAWWYDRSMINMGKENYYGQYGKKDFCKEELLVINERRKSIGLQALGAGAGCE